MEHSVTRDYMKFKHLGDFCFTPETRKRPDDDAASKQSESSTIYSTPEISERRAKLRVEFMSEMLKFPTLDIPQRNPRKDLASTMHLFRPKNETFDATTLAPRGKHRRS
jgi:hypothetical protein